MTAPDVRGKQSGARSSHADSDKALSGLRSDAHYIALVVRRSTYGESSPPLRRRTSMDQARHFPPSEPKLIMMCNLRADA